MAWDKGYKCSFDTVRKAVATLDPAYNEKFDMADDISSGSLFADVFKMIARYNITSKCWYVYDGKRWIRDDGDIYIEKLAKMLCRALYLYASDTNREYQNYAVKLQNRRNRSIMIQDARDFYPMKAEDLDADGKYFNVQNGILNLENLTLLSHNPDLLLSKIANVTYDPDMKSDVFEKFISEIMLNDQDKIRFIQKLLGYALTAENTEEKLFIFYGSSTRNGKSTLLETFGNMLGEYAGNMSPETISQRPHDTRTASGDIARLDGIRFLHASEPPKKMIFDVALIKTFTGRDRVTARHIFEREFEFIPIFKLFINTNHLPLISDDTVFSSGRIVVTTFDRHFSDEEQDKSLKGRLLKPENLSGLLNWCLKGLNDYRDNGLVIPDSVKDATEEYRQNSDKVGVFIRENMIPDPYSNLKAGDVFERYSEWCRANNYGCENKRNFMQELRTKGMLATTGTIVGKTVKNVVKGYSFLGEDETAVDDFVLINDNENPFKIG